MLTLPFQPDKQEDAQDEDSDDFGPISGKPKLAATGTKASCYLVDNGLDPTDPSVKKVVCISDTHGQHRAVKVPQCDVLIHAGDFTSYCDPSFDEFDDFFGWLSEQQTSGRCKEAVFLPGNHDSVFDQEYHDRVSKKAKYSVYRSRIPANIHCLLNSSTKVCDLTVWGIAYMPPFSCNSDKTQVFTTQRMKPHGNYRDRNGQHIKAAAAGCPKDADITVSHMPPKCHGDLREGHAHDGCEVLYERIHVVRPQLHVSGHMHEGYGVTQQKGLRTKFVTACQKTHSHADAFDAVPKKERFPVMVYVKAGGTASTTTKSG